MVSIPVGRGNPPNWVIDYDEGPGVLPGPSYRQRVTPASSRTTLNAVALSVSDSLSPI